MKTIKLRDGHEYPILFDVNVMEKIQKRYGDISNLSMKLRDLEEITWIISTLVNEGCAYEAYMYSSPAKHISAEQMGVLLTPGDLISGAISQTVIDAFNESLGDEKNLSAEELMTLANQVGTMQPNLTPAEKKAE